MRRALALVTLAAAATFAPAMPAAHAEPLCEHVWTEGTIEIIAYPTVCAPFAYGTWCEDAGVDLPPTISVEAVVCYPAI